MNGVILAYSNDVAAGVIRAGDGKRVFFNRKHWMSTTPPSVEFSNGPQGMLQVYFESDARTKIAA